MASEELPPCRGPSPLFHTSSPSPLPYELIVIERVACARYGVGLCGAAMGNPGGEGQGQQEAVSNGTRDRAKGTSQCGTWVGVGVVAADHLLWPPAGPVGTHDNVRP